MFPVGSVNTKEMLKILPVADWGKFGACMNGTTNSRNWGVVNPEPPNQFLPTEVAEIGEGKLANYDGCLDTFDPNGKRTEDSSYCCTYNEVKNEADNILRVLKKYNVKVRRPTGLSVEDREGNYGEMFTKVRITSCCNVSYIRSLCLICVLLKCCYIFILFENSYLLPVLLFSSPLFCFIFEDGWDGAYCVVINHACIYIIYYYVWPAG